MGSFKEELQRVRETRFGAVPRVWQVGRCLAASSDAATTVPSLRELVLDWASGKWPGLIPKGAWQGEAFEVMQAGLNIAALDARGQDMWAFRSEHIDKEAARSWVTEVLAATLDGRRAFGIRNLCSSLGSEPPAPSMPRFTRDAVMRFDFRDADWRIAATPHELESEADGERFTDFLKSRARTLPVNVLTKDRFGNFALDGYRLARDTVGVAHVILASTSVTHVMTEVLGTEWSVFNGAVRTYYPRFDPFADDLYRHPLTLATRVSEFEVQSLKGAPAFHAFLVRVLHDRSCAPSNEGSEFPDFFAVKGMLLAGRARTAKDAELVPILEEQLRITEGERGRWESYAVEMSEQLDTANARIFELQAQTESLTAALERQRAGRPPDADPTSYDEMVPWAERALTGKLKLHSRAVRALKNAAYEDPQLVVDGLKALANEYRNVRLAPPEEAAARREALDARLRQLGLERAGAITREQAGAFDDEYVVDYPIGQRARQRFEEHLGRGNAREERHCLRIYYFWDPEQKLVVVGSLPGHLRNRLT